MELTSKFIVSVFVDTYPVYVKIEHTSQFIVCVFVDSHPVYVVAFAYWFFSVIWIFYWGLDFACSNFTRIFLQMRKKSEIKYY